MVHPDLLKDIQRIDFMVCKIVGGLMAQRKAKRSIPNGQRNGIHYEWYNNGQLEREMRYKKGQQYGDQKGWKENGELKFSYIFRKGKRYGFVGTNLCMSPYQ